MAALLRAGVQVLRVLGVFSAAHSVIQTTDLILHKAVPGHIRGEISDIAAYFDNIKGHFKTVPTVTLHNAPQNPLEGFSFALNDNRYFITEPPSIKHNTIYSHPTATTTAIKAVPSATQTTSGLNSDEMFDETTTSALKRVSVPSPTVAMPAKISTLPLETHHSSVRTVETYTLKTITVMNQVPIDPPSESASWKSYLKIPSFVKTNDFANAAYLRVENAYLRKGLAIKHKETEWMQQRLANETGIGSIVLNLPRGVGPDYEIENGTLPALQLQYANFQLESGKVTAQLHKENKRLSDSLAFAEMQFASCKNKSRAKAKSSHSALLILESQKNSADMDLDYAKSNLQKQNAQIKQLREIEDALNADNNELEYEKHHLRADLEDVLDSNRGQRKEFNELYLVNRGLEDEKRQLTAENAALKTSLQDQSHQLAAARSRISRLRHERAIILDEKESLHSIIGGLSNEIERLEKDFLGSVFKNLNVDSEDSGKAMSILEGKNAEMMSGLKKQNAELTVNLEKQRQANKLSNDTTIDAEMMLPTVPDTASPETTVTITHPSLTAPSPTPTITITSTVTETAETVQSTVASLELNPQPSPVVTPSMPSKSPAIPPRTTEAFPTSICLWDWDDRRKYSQQRDIETEVDHEVEVVDMEEEESDTNVDPGVEYTFQEIAIAEEEENIEDDAKSNEVAEPIHENPMSTEAPYSITSSASPLSSSTHTISHDHEPAYSPDLETSEPQPVAPQHHTTSPPDLSPRTPAQKEAETNPAQRNLDHIWFADDPEGSLEMAVELGIIVPVAEEEETRTWAWGPNAAEPLPAEFH